MGMQAVFDHLTAIAAPFTGPKRKQIEEFLEDTCFLASAERAEGELIRMLLQELADNWCKHGSAKFLRLETSAGTLTLSGPDDGFSLADLSGSESPSGGAHAWKIFTRHYADVYWVREEGDDNLRSIALGRVSALGPTLNPCGVALEDTRSDAWFEESVFLTCSALHVYLPERPMFSDLSSLVAHLEAGARQRTVILHGVVGNQYLAEFVLDRCPSVRLA